MLFSLVVAPVCILTNSKIGFRFLYNILTTCCLLILLMAILTAVKWSLIMVLICISLMASDAEHHFICFWGLCMPSLEKCVLKTFVHLFLFFFFFNFYCYSITVVCLFSPSLHPTPAEPTSLPHVHPLP